MAEYIEREAAIESFRKNLDGGYVLTNDAQTTHILQSIPAADVRPLVRAVWRRYSPFTDTYECSNCGEQVIDQQFRTNFCPNCGAEMRPQPPKEET